jgi:hypothetical protein
MIANFKKLKTKTLVNERFAFWCKGWIFQKVNPKDQPSDKMMQMLGTIQKHGKKKKIVIFFNNFNSLLIYLCVHKMCLCDSPIRLQRVWDKSTNTLQFQISYKILSK